MDKLYFYVLQTDLMLIKWLPDCEKKSTELLRDTSLLGQVMTNCDADIDWGSNKEEEIVEDDEDNDDEGSDDDDSSLERDDDEDIQDDDTELFDFSRPSQVSLCAWCDCQLLPLNLLISFLVLVTKVTLICLSTGETD